MKHLFRENKGSFFVIASMVVAVTLPATLSHAGGLYINEFGTTSMGVAGAGAQAFASDASTVMHNPAGMTRLEGSQWIFGGAFGYADVRFTPDPSSAGPDGGYQGGFFPVITALYANEISDKWSFGLGFGSISGTVLDPDDDWVGRRELLDVSFLTLTSFATVGYRVNEHFSLGASGGLTYGTMDLKVAGPLGIGDIELDSLDDVAPVWSVSALFEFNPRSRLGISYVGETDLNLSGDINFNPVGITAGLDTDLPLAALARLGWYQDLGEKFTLLATVGWEDWSTLENQFVSTDMGTFDIPRNWEDTEHYSLGFHFRPNDRLTWQWGYTYDSSPVSDADRTADLPVDEQNRLAFGFLYDKSEKVSLGGSFVYVDLGDARINSATYSGEYGDNNLFYLGFNVNWKKGS